MEALKAVGLTPLSVLSKRTGQPKKSNLSITAIPTFKNQPLSNNPTNQDCTFSISRTLQGGLVLLSSVLSSGLAKALTYEETLQQSVTSSGGGGGGGGGGGVGLDDLIGFAADNPLAIGGGVAALAVPLVVSQLIGGKPKAWGLESAKAAYAKLGEDANAQLLDIRSTAEIRQVGVPDVKGLKKRAVSVVYKGDDKPGFLDKLASKFKEPENTTLYILDKFDGNSELVAELVTANGFKGAYAIKDGAEGPRGWLSSGLPWIAPKKALSLDLSNLTESISGAFGDASDAVPVTLAVAAAAGLGLLAFTEVETILQVLGSAAIVQFVSKKLLFAEDRKQTIQQIEEVLNTKVGAKELVGDLQQIGKALLPAPVTSKALPAPTEAAPAPAPAPASATAPVDYTVQKSESIPEANNVPPEVEAPKAEAAAPEVNSVPKAEVQEKSLPGSPRPLSPYPNYPDLKPPSSPIPSQP